MTRLTWRIRWKKGRWVVRRINANLYPKDGYYFKESDGAHIRAGNWRALIKTVTAYRQRQRIAIGDVESEVIAQACSRQPNICFEDRGHVVPKTRVTLKVRVLKWLNAFTQSQRKQPLAYVDAATATQRAAICAACPKNGSLGVSSCSTCKQALAEYRKMLLGAARVRDGRLGGCEILGSDLVTAAHLDEIRIDDPALPGHCWRKKAI